MCLFDRKMLDVTEWFYDLDPVQIFWGNGCPAGREEFCTSVGVELSAGKFERRLGKPRNSLSGNFTY